MGIAAFPRMIPETHDRAHPSWSTMAEIEDGLVRVADKPALIVWATKDPAFRRPHLERWQRVFPHHAGPCHVRAGHYLQEDAGPEILARIMDWVQTVRGRQAAAASTR